MNRLHLLAWILWASLFGLCAALLRGTDLVVSIELWLAGFATWLGAIVIVQMIRVAPVSSAAEDRASARRRRGPRVRPRPVGLRQLELLVRQANGDPRAFTAQLQPRLIALADHYLPLNHGADRLQHPDRVRAILGPTSRFIETAEGAESPTLDDLEQFVTALTSEPASYRSTQSHPGPVK